MTKIPEDKAVEAEVITRIDAKKGETYTRVKAVGNKHEITVDNVDSETVKIKDVDGMHFIPVANFTTQYFKA